VVLVPIRTSGPDASLPMGVFVVNTGAPQNPAWPTVPGGFVNEPQGPPYFHETNGVSDGACSTRVVLQDLGLKFYPDPTVGTFLHGLGNFAAVNLTDTDVAFPADANQTLRNAVSQASQQYHDQIDPRGLRPTLSCFKVVNRMPLKAGETCPELATTSFVPQPPLGETKAAYANTIDLGFGREMHCVQDGANVACYVSNYDALVYTGPGQGSDVTKAQSAVDGINGIKQPDATVAMEFSPIEDALPSGGLPTDPITFSDTAQVVKFYVFVYGNNPAGAPANAANLDGLGARRVPQLCMVCHGGHIPNPSGVTQTQSGIQTPVFGSRNDVKLDSKFLPFDLQNLTFVAAGNFSKTAQEDAFRQLNAMAKIAPPPNVATDPTSNVISALFDAWYPGNVSPQIPNVAVALWDDPADPKRAQHKQIYIDTLGRACRTCHVTNADSGLRFDRPSTFDARLGAVQTRVCLQHVMPHARRTHDLFWTSISPSQPAGLQA
jgi:hypothetical protein